jgi:hypothetical protein
VKAVLVKVLSSAAPFNMNVPQNFLRVKLGVSLLIPVQILVEIILIISVTS